MGLLDNRVFRAMNRFDDRMLAELERSRFGRLAHRIDTRFARPYPPIWRLPREERESVGWVLIGRLPLSDPTLLPYLWGRVEYYRRGLRWFAVPMFVVFGGLLITQLIMGWFDGAGGLMIPALSPLLHYWTRLRLAKNAVAANGHPLLSAKGAV